MSSYKVLLAGVAMTVPLSLGFGDTTARAVNYTTTNTIDLTPANLLGANPNSLANGISGNQQVGEGDGSNTGSNYHALLWSGTTASVVDLNPPLLGTNSGSNSIGVYGSRQVGSGYGSNTSNLSHALLWSGTAASAVDLHPAALLGPGSNSFANAISGSQEVGYGYGGNAGSNYHALLWNGTASSAVDLNPASMLGTTPNSVAKATSGSQQFGYGYGGNTGGAYNALVWSGTAASAVDLNPAVLLGTNSYSYIEAVSGNQLVGAGGGGNTGNSDHALLWSGSAGSAIDLHPAALLGGNSISYAYGTSGSQQIGSGRGYNTGGNYHALLWSGSAASAVDLHDLLPVAFTSSQAQAIDAYGNIAGIGTDNTNAIHAVEWLAGDMYNVNGSGAWSTASNWTSATPTSGNDVLLIQSDSTNRAIIYTNNIPSTVLGQITIDATGAGTMTVNQSQDALTSSSELLGFIGTGTFNQSGGTHVVNGVLTLAAKTGSQGAYNLSGSGSLHVGSVLLNAGGTFNQTGGTLYAGTFTQSGGTVSGTLQNQGLFVYQSGTFSARLLNQGTLSLGPNFTASNGIENDANMTLGAGQTLTVNGNGLDNLGSLTLSGGTITGVGAATNDYGATMSVQSGNSTLSNSSLSNYGTMAVGSVLTLSVSPVLNYGLINLNTGGIIRQNGVYNYGTTTLSGGALTAACNNYGTVQGGGSISGSLSNNAGSVINANNPAIPLVLSSLTSNSAGASLEVTVGSSLSVNTSWTNSGVVALTGAGAILGGGTITNSGTIQGAGTISSPVTNSGGIIRASGGELDLLGAVLGGVIPSLTNVTSNGVGSRIEASSGNTVMYVQGLVTNAGTIALTGGAFDNNNQPLSNASSGIINGYGTLRTGGLTSTGKLNVGEGNLDVLGNVTNNGTIGIQGGRYIYFFGNVNGSGSYTGVGTATFLAAVSPGNSPAAVSFAGNVDLTSTATLNIELGGTTVGSQYDKLNVTGQLTIGGVLNVVLYNDFKPAAGDLFDILDWGSRIGTFDSLQLPALAGGLTWNTSQLYNSGVLSVVSAGLVGDYNGNGIVDAGDYIVWRKNQNTTHTLANDPIGGTIGQGQYDQWRANFGHPVGSGAGVGTSAAVPEPATTVLLMFAAAGWCIRRRPAA